jgi:hypothetical protein
LKSMDLRPRGCNGGARLELTAESSAPPERVPVVSSGSKLPQSM